jgi:hypothetical protein
MNSYNDNTYKEIRGHGRVEEGVVSLEDLKVMVGKPHNTNNEIKIRIDMEKCMMLGDGSEVKHREVGSSGNAEENNKSSGDGVAIWNNEEGLGDCSKQKDNVEDDVLVIMGRSDIDGKWPPLGRSKNRDREYLETDIEYCGTHTASYRELGGAGCIGKTDINSIKESVVGEELDRQERKTGDHTDTGEIESALWRIENDEGWVRLERNNMEKLTGKWERLLLRSNLGRRWMERIKELGAIPRHIGDFVSKFETMVKDSELSAGMTLEEIMKLVVTASLRSGYRLKARRSGSELELTKAKDDEVEITIDLDDLVVHLWRRNTPGTVKGTSHRDVAVRGALGIGFNNGGIKQAHPQWTHEIIKGDDLIGLSWILKLHSNERITRRGRSWTPTEGEIAWTKNKFETINKKGKCDLLKYLAAKTGSELTVYSSKGKLKVVVPGRTPKSKLLYNTRDDTITVSLSEILSHGKLTELTTDTASTKIIKTPKEDDDEWIRTIGNRAVLHKSDDCERIRRICRKNNGTTYPPVVVTNIFEHLRAGMTTRPSAIAGAGDGLHIGRAVKKDQIIGVYEGIVVAEAEGEYVLEIGNGKKRTIWVDADPRITPRLSVFGMMNESFDEEKYNAELGEDGFIRALRDCSDEELFTKYGPKYNWDPIKTRALHKLIDEVEERFPTMRGRISRSWSSILESSCNLEMWVRRVIEGRCANNELHGIKIEEQDKQKDGMGEV